MIISDGCWAADQGSSSVDSKRSTQAAKLSEDGVSSQPELEESSQSKTTKRRMLVSWDDVVPWLVPRWLLMVMVLVSSIFGFWLQEKAMLAMQLPRPLRLLALVQMLALLLSLAWNEHLLRNYMHMQNRVSREVVLLVKLLLVVTMVGMAGRMLSLWWQEVLLVEMAVVLLIINLDRVVNFWCVKNAQRRDRKKKNFRRLGMHGHAISPVKCEPHDHEWVLDTGASAHFTSKLELLLEVQRFQEVDYCLYTADGQPKHVQFIGSVRTNSFDFPGVHCHTGGGTMNIVSVSQLVRDHGLVTEFDPTSCWIKERKTGKIVGKGHITENHRYILDYLRIGQNVAGDRGASSGGEHGGGGRGNGGRVDSSMAEGRGVGGRSRDGRRGGTRASMGLLGRSRFVLVLCLCIAACISLLQSTSRGTGVICKLATFYNHDFRSLLGFSLLFISSLDMLQSTSRKLVKQIGSLFQESPHEHNRRLFGLSRFDDVTTGHGRYQLRIGPLLASSTNTARRREEFILDSGASYHTIWNEQIIVSYPKDLKDHTEPPTQSLGGVNGSVDIKSSGYLRYRKIKLDGVLLAPKSRLNLISVGQLAVQYQVKVILDDEGFIIQRKQDEATIGGGKMIDNHLYELDYFEPPEGLFAARSRTPEGLFDPSRTPNFKIFGTATRDDPGQPQVNTGPCPARSTTTEETVSPSANQQEATKSSSLGERRSRKRSRNYFGPLWFNG